MNSNSNKKWTILIYADGNNEMEEIMCKSFLDMELTGSNEDVNVIVQIGKLGNYRNNEKYNWSGVRRYYVNYLSSMLIEDLGKENMADPNVLYTFIKWGIENYKAEHYMLVLSDHGGDFVGCFTDLSLKVPYIMGIPEMIEAINTVKKNLDMKIDILLFDMCYMNSIEVLYELGQDEDNTVKTAITYMDYAAYEGINYYKLISSVEDNCNLSDIPLFTKYLIDNQQFSLVSYEINHSKLEEIKELFNKIAGRTKNPLNLVNNLSHTNNIPFIIKRINKKLKGLIIYCKNTFLGLNTSIKITSNSIDQLILFYKKLAFSKNNKWTNLLMGKASQSKFTAQKNKVKVSLSNLQEPVIHYILKFNNTINK